jgi:predicted amidohydrolase YtcJ
LTKLLIRDCSIGGVSSHSVYCEDGRIARIEKGGEIAAAPGTETIEANGGTLLPGLIDSHCHPFEYGWLKRNVDLRGASNITGVRLRLQSGVQRSRPGDWVVGMGWDQEQFPGRTMPRKEDIDDISPSNPVALSRICGHIALLNSRAIEALEFASRPGPEFERDSGGMTGIVKETAVTETFARVPRTAEVCAADLQAVEAEAARLGLTALHCIVSPEGFREELAALSQLEASGSLSLRYRVYIPPEALEFEETNSLLTKMKGDKVKINGVKIFADGSLGARTAALREPYSDDPSNSGMLRMGDEEISRVVEMVDAKDLQAIIHAIGDRAVEQAVEALATVTGSGNPRRHRIEHAGLIPRDLRRKMARHGIRASVQPLFVTSDTWAVDRLGEDRVRDLYPFKSMLAEGIVVSGSSDSPIESISPVLGMWASMTRGGSVPEESLGLDEAVALYTSSAASNGFDEAHLAEGAPANLTLLDSDTTGMHPALLRRVGVLATVVDGSAVHSFGSG